MTSVSLLTVWLVLSAAGIALVYRIGIYLERWSRATSVVCLVLLAPAALIGGCVAAHKSCDSIWRLARRWTPVWIG
jgi:hypothetical protein